MATLVVTKSPEGVHSESEWATNESFIWYKDTNNKPGNFYFFVAHTELGSMSSMPLLSIGFDVLYIYIYRRDMYMQIEIDNP